MTVNSISSSSSSWIIINLSLKMSFDPADPMIGTNIAKSSSNSTATTS